MRLFHRRAAIRRLRPWQRPAPNREPGHEKRELLRTVQRNPPPDRPAFHLQHEPVRGHGENRRLRPRGRGGEGVGKPFRGHSLRRHVQPERGDGDEESRPGRREEVGDGAWLRLRREEATHAGRDGAGGGHERGHGHDGAGLVLD